MADFIPELVWENARPLGVNTDLDKLRKNGYYSVTNPPGVDAGDYHLWVMRIAGGTGAGYCYKQILMSAHTTDEYVRQDTGEGYSEWTASGGGGASSPYNEHVVSAKGRINSTAFDADGLILTVQGSVSGTHDGSKVIQRMAHATLASAASSNSTTYVRTSYPEIQRGRDTGFKFEVKFGFITDILAKVACFVGISSFTLGMSSAASLPSAYFRNCVGLYRDTDTEFFGLTIGNGSTYSTYDLGDTFGDFINDDLYHLTIECPPGVAQDVTVTIARLNPGRLSTHTEVIPGNTATLPVSETPMYGVINTHNAGVATVHRLGVLEIKNTHYISAKE